MEELYSIIDKSYLFHNIEEKDLSHLIGCLGAMIRSYDEDKFLFLAGEKVDMIGIVMEGIIEILKESISGERHIIAFLEEAEMFAEGIVSTISKSSPVTARAKAGSKVLWIPYDRIINTCGSVCEYHIKLIHNMVTILGEKNVILNKKIELLTLKGMRERIARYLLNEELERGKSTFQILLNRTELADYLNVSRTSMCRELTKMKEEKIIDYYGKSFKIIKKDELIKSLDN